MCTAKLSPGKCSVWGWVGGGVSLTKLWGVGVVHQHDKEGLVELKGARKLRPDLKHTHGYFYSSVTSCYTWFSHWKADSSYDMDSGCLVWHAVVCTGCACLHCALLALHCRQYNSESYLLAKYSPWADARPSNFDIHQLIYHAKYKRKMSTFHPNPPPKQPKNTRKWHNFLPTPTS